MSQIEPEQPNILDIQATEAFNRERLEMTGEWMKATYNRFAKRKIRSAHMVFGNQWRSTCIFGKLIVQCKRGGEVFPTLHILAAYVIWHMEGRRDDFNSSDFTIGEVYSYHAVEYVFGKKVFEEVLFRVIEFETISVEEENCRLYANLSLAVYAKSGLLKDIRLQTLRADLARATELAGDTTISFEELPDLLDEVCDHLDSMFKE